MKRHPKDSIISYLTEQLVRTLPHTDDPEVAEHRRQLIAELSETALDKNIYDKMRTTQLLALHNVIMEACKRAMKTRDTDKLLTIMSKAMETHKAFVRIGRELASPEETPMASAFSSQMAIYMVPPKPIAMNALPQPALESKPIDAYDADTLPPEQSEEDKECLSVIKGDNPRLKEKGYGTHIRRTRIRKCSAKLPPRELGEAPDLCNYRPNLGNGEHILIHDKKTRAARCE